MLLLFINECVGSQMVSIASALPHGLAVSVTGRYYSMQSRTSSFSRSLSSQPAINVPGVKLGHNGRAVISTGIEDLDKILGGGFPLATLVVVMEDGECPHHLLLLRNFMAQGVVHNQSLFYANPSKEPRAFLGTLPSPIVAKDDKHEKKFPQDLEQDKNLRIAWQYKKYIGGQQNLSIPRESVVYCHDFDLRKPLGRSFFGSKKIICTSLQDSSLELLQDESSKFLAEFSRNDGGGVIAACRVAIQSFGAPQCGFSGKEWDMLSYIRSLRSTVQSSNAVAVVTFPPSVMSSSFSKRLQHLADTLLSVRAIPDEDKDMAKLLTGYQDMLGLLHVHKVAQINTQVPIILDATTFSIKLQKRRSLVLERLNQAPVDGSSGSSYQSASAGCGSSIPSLDF